MDVGARADYVVLLKAFSPREVTAYVVPSYVTSAGTLISEGKFPSSSFTAHVTSTCGVSVSDSTVYFNPESSNTTAVVSPSALTVMEAILLSGSNGRAVSEIEIEFEC